eukprot:COSAG04_NODE_25593_length_305_cov_1.237864_1_plen_51_part_10
MRAHTLSCHGTLVQSLRLRMRRFAAAKQFAEAGAAKDEKEAAAKLLEEKQA